MEWDEGKGFDYRYPISTSLGYQTERYRNGWQKLLLKTEQHGLQPETDNQWDNDGIYTNDYLSEQYDKICSKDRIV